MQLTDIRRSVRALTSALVLPLMLGCSGESTQAVDANVGSIRILMNGVDVTAHVPLNSGFTQRFVVALHSADGRRITGLDEQFAISFAFDPPSLAEAAAVDGRPLEKDVISNAAPETAGSLHVTVARPELSTTRTFGPFEVLIH